MIAKKLLLATLILSSSLYSSQGTQQDKTTTSQTKTVLAQVTLTAIPVVAAGIVAFVLAPRLGWTHTDIQFSCNTRLAFCNPFYLGAMTNYLLSGMIPEESSIGTILEKSLDWTVPHCGNKASRLVGAGYAWIGTTYLLPKVAPINNDRLTIGLCAGVAIAAALLAPK